MSQFNFRLQTILRLREAERDRRRNELAEALAAERALSAQLAKLQADLEALQRELISAASPGSISVEKLLEGRRYEVTLQAQAKFLEGERAKILAEIDRRRLALTQADMAVKVLEKLRQRRLTQWESEQVRRTLRELDELASSRSGIQT
ncbi:MAG: flagellar export protein FliJ [Thermoguttaceae bacterium]|nr:flagellar export protein FliJ [Thermoguttaceae bacterium]MDW8077454.1 flagellar export protein FliJ [Thermoguttaceae bacterium]